MAMKDIWAKTGSWLRAQKLSKAVDYHPQIDDEGLISPDTETRQPPDDKPQEQDSQVLAKSVASDPLADQAVELLLVPVDDAHSLARAIHRLDQSQVAVGAVGNAERHHLIPHSPYGAGRD